MMDLLRHGQLLSPGSILICLTAAVISVAWSPRQLSFLHPPHRRLPNCDGHLRCMSSLTHPHPHFSSRNEDQSNDNVPQPPTAFRNESSFILAGDLGRCIPDPYAWLRDDSRADTAVLSHLHAENEYTRRMTQHLDSLREELYREFLSSMQETESTAPVAEGGYWYYSRYEEGDSYPLYCRAPRKLDDLYPPAVRRDPNLPRPPLLPHEEVYLDLPEIARNRTYLAVGTIVVSPNREYVAYTLDETGGETCHFYVRRISSGEEWVLYDNHDGGSKRLLKGYGAIVWDEESIGIFYVTMDETHRPYRVYYRRLFRLDGSYIKESERQNDELLLEEEDKRFNVHIEKTFDGKYLLISRSSSEASDVHYLDLRPRPRADLPIPTNLACIARRRNKVLYRVTHCKGHWLIQTNQGSLPNFTLKACPVGKESDGDSWKDVVLLSTGNAAFDGGHRRSFDGITVFDPSPDNSDGVASPFAFGVATGREDGLPRVWILEFSQDEPTGSGSDSSPLVVTKFTRLEFAETASNVGVGANRDPTLPYVVVDYDSLVTPLSQIAVPLCKPSDLDARRVLKEKQVPGYEKDLYACERTTVRSRDGKTDIPISLVYRRDVLHHQTANTGGIPTHLYGYGSYGSSIEASFRATRLSLLNRGVVFAIAHVRGGGEMGRPWYENAKYLCKMNSFNDFVDVARWLTGDGVESSEAVLANDSGYDNDWNGITTAAKLSCEGRSAGGLLIGVAINQAPHLFRAAILGVPFVDVLCTMMDATIPLTIAEWEEWGNPNEEHFFHYMKSYSPINNVRYGQMYPACLLTGGLYDPRVQYWEPAKFAAELRHGVSKDSGKVLLKIDMDAGHFSGNDRYKHLRELSFDYAFLLDELGLV